MKKKIILISLISLSIFIGGCGSNKTVKSTSNNTSPESSNNNNSNSTSPVEKTYKLEKNGYTDKNVTVTYPQVTNLLDNSKETTINELIRNEALSDFSKGVGDNLDLKIDYTIKLESADILSIQYSGEGFTKGASHPSNYFYTTNIDMKSGKRLKLANLVNIDENLVKKFKEAKYMDWETKDNSENSKKKQLGVTGFVNSIATKDLIKYFNQSDGRGIEENPSNTFSFLTNNSIVISINVLHPIGDHAEYQIDYQIESLKTRIEDKVKVKEESKKQEYKTKLDNIEIGFKVLKEKEAGTTADMVEAANERLKQWDAALNEIYNVLKCQLSASYMKKLQSEEIQWIANRDAQAKKESLEMKGGTMEPLIYTSSLQDTTKKRCYELVEKYMK